MMGIDKYKLLIWLVVALVALNLSTIGTVVWQVSKNKQPGTQLSRSTFGPRPQQGLMPLFTEKMNFDDAQMAKFNKANGQFRTNARTTAERMAQHRRELLDEMDKNKPDTLVLNAISDEIGYAHAELKRLTCHFYLDVKSICRADQQEALRQVFGTLMQTDGPGQGPGMHHQMRQRRGNKRPFTDTIN